MKILSIVKNNYTNDARVHKTVTSLIKMGHDVEVMAVKEQKEIPLFERKEYSIYRIPLFSSIYSTIKSRQISNIRGNKSKNSLTKLKEVIKKNKFRLFCIEMLNSLFHLILGLSATVFKKIDMIYANDLDTLLLASILSKIKKCPVIYDSHEIWLEGVKFQSASKLKKYFWKILEKKMIGKVDKVLTTTNYRAKYLENKYNLKNIEVVKNCPPSKKITKNNIFREEFKIKKEDKIIIYQGLIDRRRGIFTMVDIMTEIPNAVLVFMGIGPDKKKLYSYIVKKNITGKVFVKDAVPFTELPEYTASADIGLQLLFNTGVNHYSTISNKVFEYVNVGIALVASDFPEIRKIVEGNSVGIVVDPENKDEIIKAVNKIIQNIDFYKKNAVENRYKYCWENEERVLEKIFKDLAQ